jgi:hypothetical protein
MWPLNRRWLHCRWKECSCSSNPPPEGGTLAVGYFLVPESALEPRIPLWHPPSFEEIAAAEAKEKSDPH